ncbi:hypothetical protein CBR_g25767 [Chara braunii]|uniref:Uncharacterized protein n=1 Tax=Chara braunii TaxID=69332 RepID=A0A388L6B4_CHABU|nr:hypothetical protein CBR_g25767 [Chara braunii]|eukprot:GBG77837.1 hypothetical protein CBR_g25767 [Chara braunii]
MLRPRWRGGAEPSHDNHNARTTADLASYWLNLSEEHRDDEEEENNPGQIWPTATNSRANSGARASDNRVGDESEREAQMSWSARHPACGPCFWQKASMGAADPSGIQSAEVMIRRGLRHYYGVPGKIPMDLKKAEDCFRQASEQGDDRAGVLLNRCILAAGDSDSHARATAERKLLASKEDGTEGAAIVLAEYYIRQRREPQEVFDLLNKEISSASKYAKEAQFLLSQFYIRTGAESTWGEGYSRAVSLAERSGCPSSNFFLGLYHLKGLYRFKKDPSRGVELISKAAREDHPLAKVVLSTCYAKGIGVKKSEPEAWKWLKSGVDQGCVEAETLAGLSILRGKLGQQINEQQGEDHLQKAADNGYFFAQIALGLHFEQQSTKQTGSPQSGKAVSGVSSWSVSDSTESDGSKDFQSEAALKWYLKAASNAHVRDISEADLLASSTLRDLGWRHGRSVKALVQTSVENITRPSQDLWATFAEVKQEVEVALKAGDHGLESIRQDWLAKGECQLTDYDSAWCKVLSDAYTSAAAVAGKFTNPAVEFDYADFVMTPLTSVIGCAFAGSAWNILQGLNYLRLEHNTKMRAQQFTGLARTVAEFESVAKEAGVCLALVRRKNMKLMNRVRSMGLEMRKRDLAWKAMTGEIRIRDAVREILGRNHNTSDVGPSGQGLDLFSVLLAAHDALRFLQSVANNDFAGVADRRTLRQQMILAALGMVGG